MSRTKSKASATALNPFAILMATLGVFRGNLKKILIITALVTIPAALLRAVQIDSTTDASLLASFAGFFLSLALYRAFSHPKALQSEKTPEIYVQSSARILPYILTTVFFSVGLLPLVLGLLLTLMAFSSVVPIWIALPSALVTLAGLYVAIRLSIGTTIAAIEPSSAITAMRASWRLSKGLFWKLLVAWLVVFAIITIVAGIILSLVARVGFIEQNDYVLAVINGLLLCFVLPLVIGYATNIYERMA